MDKEYLINKSSKKEFSDFLANDETGLILQLLDDEGIKILTKSKLKEDRINYILHYSKYRDELFNNPNFVIAFLNSDISYYYATIIKLNKMSSKILMNAAFAINKDDFFVAHLFDYFAEDIKLDMLESWPYSYDVLLHLLSSNSASVINKIVNNYLSSLEGKNINFLAFFDRAKESAIKAYRNINKNETKMATINVPSNMITKNLAKEIFDKYDIYAVRTIINSASYCTDASYLNNYVKQLESGEIKKAFSGNLLKPFQDIYDIFEIIKISEEKEDGLNNEEYHDYLNLKRKYRHLLEFTHDTNLGIKLNKCYLDKGMNGVKEYLETLNNFSLSNYIIDYHFEENYHNIMLDMNELLNFYFSGYIHLPEERIALYEKIVNIDNLDIIEKMELHENLKNFKMIEIFYDDMSFAREIVREAIKDYSLTKEELNKYRDDLLSKEYGVDVYVVGDEPFFGIVKTARHVSDSLPTGHSYSLVGNGGLAVYGDVKDSNTYLYDSSTLNKEQIVHVFPYDAFTMFKPFELEKYSTRYVNTLMMPDELVEYDKSYNEILILEAGEEKTDFDSKIPELKKIALYCLDEIRKQDVLKAKSNNVGIIFVNSKKCQKSDNKERGIYRHHFENYNYCYFNGVTDKEEFEGKRMK